MNLIYIHQVFRTRSEAGSTRTYEYARALASNGHKVTVVAGAMSYYTGETPTRFKRRLITREEEEGFTILWVRVLLSYKRSFATRLMSFLVFMILATIAGLSVGKCDAVVATSPPLTVGVPGYLISRLRRAAFVFEVRDLWPASAVGIGVLRNRLLIWIAEITERFFYRRAARLVALTQGIRNALLQQGCTETKVVLIPHAADVELFTPQARDEVLRAELGVHGKFVAIYAGALGMANGVEAVLEAARVLQEEGADWAAFVIIGDGMMKQRLMWMIEQYGLGNVRLLSSLPKVAMPRYLASADVGLMVLQNLQVFEMACPNKLFDYMAAGIPVLVNFPGEARALVEEHGAGLYVEPDDPWAMARALAELNRDRKSCAEMGRNGRRLVEAVHTRESTTNKLEEVLLSCV